MKFLIDAALPPWMIDAFSAAGYDAIHADNHRGSAYMRFLLGKLFEHLRDGGTIDGKLLIVEADHIRTRG